MKSNRKIIMSAFTLLLAAISLAGCAKVAREQETTTAPETTTEEQTTSARGAETTRRASGSSNTASKTTEFQVDFDAIRMLGVPKFRAYADLGDGFSSTGKTATVNGVKCKTYKITFEDSDDVLLAYDEQNKVLYEYDNETKDWIEL